MTDEHPPRIEVICNTCRGIAGLAPTCPDCMGKGWIWKINSPAEPWKYRDENPACFRPGFDKDEYERKSKATRDAAAQIMVRQPLPLPMPKTAGPLAEGTTAKFGTGAVRSDTVEAFRYDLVSPIGLREVARACAEGAAKYGDWNWENGMPVHDLLNHATAHIFQFLAGDRSEPHLGHAAWNLLAAIHSQELWPHLNEGTLRGPGCSAPKPVGTGPTV